MENTKQELKQTITNFKPTEEQIKNTEEVFLNMAKVETIKPIVEKIQEEVLKEFKFKVSKKNLKRFQEKDIYVLTENRTYLLNDGDFKKYHSECIKREEEKSLYVVNLEFCPLLVARCDLRKAEHKLLNSFESVTGIKLNDVTYSLKSYNKYIDLTLKFMVKFVRDKDEILKEYYNNGGF